MGIKRESLIDRRNAPATVAQVDEMTSGDSTGVNRLTRSLAHDGRRLGLDSLRPLNSNSNLSRD